MKSLGRWYSTSLKDTEQLDQLRKDVISGLKSIDRTTLSGKLKLYCMQFGFLPCLMWTLSQYAAPISKVENLERLINSYITKWLGLPRCLSSLWLYDKGVLELPISSHSEEYKCTKVRLEMMLTESSDPFVAKLPPSWLLGGTGPQQKHPSRHRQRSSTEMSWADSSKGGVVLALGPAYQSGTRQLTLRDAGLWCRRYVSRRRQHGA